jgi:hypothetical protein
MDMSFNEARQHEAAIERYDRALAVEPRFNRQNALARDADVQTCALAAAYPRSLENKIKAHRNVSNRMPVRFAICAYLQGGSTDNTAQQPAIATRNKVTHYASISVPIPEQVKWLMHVQQMHLS